jgi:phage gpG-like protein
MRLEIKGFAALQDRLAQVRPAEIMAQQLQEQSQRLAETVQEGLTEPVGAGDHDKPWARTGALHDSIAATSQGLEASVGSNDPAAAPQEMGTARIPPRPFLAPAAAAKGEEIARTIGSAVADAIRGNGAKTG